MFRKIYDVIFVVISIPFMFAYLMINIISTILKLAIILLFSVIGVSNPKFWNILLTILIDMDVVAARNIIKTREKQLLEEKKSGSPWVEYKVK